MIQALAILVAIAGASTAQSSDPPEDAAHRADRMQTEQLNRDALKASKPRLVYRAQDQRDYQAARKRYEDELATWRQRVTACRGGDWSACE